ncbi:MAG TPA: ABC transporter permease [Verrucomicrobiae bacterium]
MAGIGLLLCSRGQTTETAAGPVNLVSLPMIMCSGVFFSAARFPDVFQPVIRALPLTVLIESMRKWQQVVVVSSSAGYLEAFFSRSSTSFSIFRIFEE